jgi:mannose-6-phosphate isomerase-like protein (cupin superfamily)
VREAVLKLEDKKNWNRWVIGTLPAIDKTSPFYSEQIQMSYLRQPDVEAFLKKEKVHYHKSPIEEFYLVLAGQLEVSAEGDKIVLGPREMLSMPPGKKHLITSASADLELLVFRAPISTDGTKLW